MPERLLSALICLLTVALLAGGQETQEEVPATTTSHNLEEEEVPTTTTTTTTTTSAPAPPPPPLVAVPLSAAELAAQAQAARNQAAEQERLQKQEMLRIGLNEAIDQGNKSSVDQALSKGSLLNSTDFEGWSPLALLTMKSDSCNELWAVDMAKHLIFKGAGVDQRDGRGRTPLYHASRYGCVEMVKEFLKTAKDLDTSDGDGVKAVVRAIWKGHGEIAKMLYDAGADKTLAEAHAKGSEHQHIRRLFGVKEEPMMSNTMASSASSGVAGKPGEL